MTTNHALGLLAYALDAVWTDARRERAIRAGEDLPRAGFTLEKLAIAQRAFGIDKPTSGLPE